MKRAVCPSRFMSLFWKEERKDFFFFSELEESGERGKEREMGGGVLPHSKPLGSCLSQAASSSPSLPSCLCSLQSLLISCTPLPFFFFTLYVSPLPRITPSNSLQFPLTDIDWPLGGFPSSPLATGSSLPPSGAINFPPVQSCVSPYSRARA